MHAPENYDRAIADDRSFFAMLFRNPTEFNVMAV